MWHKEYRDYKTDEDNGKIQGQIDCAASVAVEMHELRMGAIHIAKKKAQTGFSQCNYFWEIK
jgi:hypothetical protein